MIDTDTPVTIGVLIGTFPLLVTMVGMWFKLRAVEKKLKVFWTVPHQKVFCERLEHRNSRLSVPDVSEVLATFNTNGTKGETT